MNYGSILNIVMTGIQSAPIGDFENTLSFPSEETSLDFGLPSYLPLGDIPCPSNPPYGFLHHTSGALNNALSVYAITAIGMFTRSIYFLYINYFFYYSDKLEGKSER